MNDFPSVKFVGFERFAHIDDSRRGKDGTWRRGWMWGRRGQGPASVFRTGECPFCSPPPSSLMAGRCRAVPLPPYFLSSSINGIPSAHTLTTCNRSLISISWIRYLIIIVQSSCIGDNHLYVCILTNIHIRAVLESPTLSQN